MKPLDLYVYYDGISKFEWVGTVNLNKSEIRSHVPKNVKIYQGIEKTEIKIPNPGENEEWLIFIDEGIYKDGREAIEEFDDELDVFNGQNRRKYMLRIDGSETTEFTALLVKMGRNKLHLSDIIILPNIAARRKPSYIPISGVV